MESNFHAFDSISATSSLRGDAFSSRQITFPYPFSSSSGSSLLPLPSRPISPDPSQSDESSLAWFNAAGILLSLRHAAIERSSRLEAYNGKMNFHETNMSQPPRASEMSGYQAEKPAANNVINMRVAMQENPEVWGGGLATQSSGRESENNQCHVCLKVYARPSTLRTHMRTHRGEKPYKCKVCFKSFTQDANLTAHLRIHSGEKPFKCQVCDRRFAQSSSVTTHMRTHTGERPYMCRVCSRAFADSSTLTKHMRTHTGEKPYQCKICRMRFSQSGNLNRHMRVHLSN